MKKIIILIQLFLILPFLFSCDRSDSDSNSGYFTITKTGGTTYKTSYVTVPLPTKAGTFSVQYNKSSRVENLDFLVLIDNNNDCGISIATNTPIKAGVYTDINAQLYGSLSNTDINYSKLKVNITSFSYPGKITGNFNAYNSAGAVLYSGDFDLTAK